MEVQGKIKLIGDTETVGSKGFRKRQLVVTTNEQYPQLIALEFVQDKVDLLDPLKVGEDVKVHINLRGREWINQEGEAKYFNTIQGWRIEPIEANGTATPKAQSSKAENEPDDLPF
jgi:translation initiation factor IF-3